MSLTSLADAPLLSKPLAGPVLAKSRCLSTPKHKEDQAAIDALFEEDKGTFADMQKDKTHREKKSFPFSKELPSLERNLILKSEAEDATQNLHLPTLPPLSLQNGETFKKKLPKQEDSLFSKTRDANNVLAGFLAGNASLISANRPPNLETEKTQREEFKSKWNSFSPEPATRLPTLTFSPRLGSGSIQHASDSSAATKSAKDYSCLSKKDGDWSTKDVLSLLPDESTKPIKEAASGVNLPMFPEESGQDEEEDSLDFGGYQPSCLSVSTHVMQQRNFNSFISLSENLDAKEKTTEKCVKTDSFSILNTLDQTKVNQDGGPCKTNGINRLTDISKNNPLQVQDSPGEKLPLQVQDSPGEKIPLNPCSIPVSRDNTTDENLGLSLETKRLRDENLALKEEIMKIEAEKLRLEKEFLEKELSNDLQVENQADVEREEAQKLAEELAVELLSVKQSLSLTEEKIDCMKKVHEHEVDMLKAMHKKELEMKERQLLMQEAFLVEKKDAMEAFSQLLSKVDVWSVRIDELHKSIVCEEGTKSSAWIGNIETMVSEHDCSLQMLEKRSTDVCNQLESVAIMLDHARKDMENLQKQEEERMSKTHIQLQAFQDIMQREHEQNLASQPASKEKPGESRDSGVQEQQGLLSAFMEEKKDLEAERETVLCMKEQLLEADANFRKQLHEYAVRMQAEAEEMARQKRELEHAKNIAAEIAVEVESSRRELYMYKTVFNRKTPEAHHEEKSVTAYCAAQKLPNFERSLDLIRKHKLYRRPYSSVDVHRRFSFGSDLLDDCEMLRSRGAISQAVDEDICYLRSQEEFLMEAEKSLVGMPLAEMRAS